VEAFFLALAAVAAASGVIGGRWCASPRKESCSGCRHCRSGPESAAAATGLVHPPVTDPTAAHQRLTAPLSSSDPRCLVDHEEAERIALESSGDFAGYYFDKGKQE